MKFSDAKKIAALKKYLAKEPQVILAFLFGSFAKGLEMRESDFDIAVYLKEKKEEAEIYHEVSKIVEKNVNLVCLEEAPANLISAIYKTGIPLAIKDKKLYWELYLRKSLEAEDFSEFVKDFWRISKKSKSLEEEEKNRILERLHFLKSELREIEVFKKLGYKEYSEDKIKRRNVERWAENILNATIDIAKIVMASEKEKMPRSYEEALLYFGIFAGLTEEESKKLAKFADLRNILAHEYLDVLYGKIQEFIKESPKFYKKMFDFLEKSLKIEK
jgi:uncharacterized protein YutE (UPF0331/DUF86 family)/predicted nucleotidyltransferase